jgi:hypothetical protein
MNTDILYSLIPLVLIILFSWLLSVLGSKKRQAPEEGQARPQGRPLDQLFDFMSTEEEERPAGVSGGQPTAVRPGGYEWGGLPEARPYQDLAGPRITPDPIKPKWWGA